MNQNPNLPKYSGLLNSSCETMDASKVEEKRTGNDLIDMVSCTKAKSMHQGQRKRQRKLKPGNSMKAHFPLMVIFSLMIFFSLVGFSEGSPKHYCLRHCHMCKQMYGRHFLIYLCKDDCVESRGDIIPDCLNLNSIQRYLDLTDSFDWEYLSQAF